MKSLKVADDLHTDLFVLKGILRTNDTTETIRRIMNHAGYTEAFFEKMEELRQSREVPE